MGSCIHLHNVTKTLLGIVDVFANFSHQGLYLLSCPPKIFGRQKHAQAFWAFHQIRHGRFAAVLRLPSFWPFAKRSFIDPFHKIQGALLLQVLPKANASFSINTFLLCCLHYKSTHLKSAESGPAEPSFEFVETSFPALRAILLV